MRTIRKTKNFCLQVYDGRAYLTFKKPLTASEAYELFELGIDRFDVTREDVLNMMGSSFKSKIAAEKRRLLAQGVDPFLLECSMYNFFQVSSFSDEFKEAYYREYSRVLDSFPMDFDKLASALNANGGCNNEEWDGDYIIKYRY